MLKRRAAPGFTLIEMLIAISLLGIMVILLFASLRTAAESWNSGEAKISDVNKKAVVYQFFKRHLSDSKPFPAFQDSSQQNNLSQDSQELPKLVFKGFKQNITFVSSLPTASARKGPQIFEVGLNPRRPTTLQVALTPYRLIDRSEVDPEPVVLLENLKDFNISYFGTDPNSSDGGDAWQPEWSGQLTGQLPKLVKVSVVLADGSFWPDMIFPLKITGQPNTESLLGNQNQPGIDNNN